MILEFLSNALILITIYLVYIKCKEENLNGFFLLAVLGVIAQVYIKPIYDLLINGYSEYNFRSFYKSCDVIIVSLMIISFLYNLKLKSNVHQFQKNLNLNKIIILYIFISLILYVFSVAQIFKSSLPRLSDLIPTACYFIIYLIFINLFHYRKFKTILILILINVILSIPSGNSSFKNVILIAIGCSLSIKWDKDIIQNYVVPCFIILIIGINIWFENKILLKYQSPSYELFDKIIFIYKNIVLIPNGDISSAIYKFVDRVGYIEFISYTIDNVQYNNTFEYGNVLLDAINRLMMPSFVYADKPIFNNSERTNYYLNDFDVVDTVNTSIGIGYFSELYIDFGPYSVLFLIITARLISKLHKYKYSVYIVPCFNFSFFYNFYLIEQSITLILASFIHTMIITLIIYMIYFNWNNDQT